MTTEVDSNEWVLSRDRLQSKCRQARETFIGRHGDAGSRMWRSLRYAYLANIRAHAGADYDNVKYLSVHVLVGSTPHLDASPRIDLPGELSIERFLDAVIAGEPPPLGAGRPASERKVRSKVPTVNS